MSSATFQAIAGFQLTTADAGRLARFYEEALGFEVGSSAPMTDEEMRVLGVSGGGVRTSLRLGSQAIELDRFERPGRSYPDGTDAADLCFQHFAIVTSDIEGSWERARTHGAAAISCEGTVRLPQGSGGVCAVKFRDPEGHPLELIRFPRGSSLRWVGDGTLGIDHSAISVGDIGAAQRFFVEKGLSVGTSTLNRGPAQDALDGLNAVEVEVVPMLADVKCPHLELLGYRNPRGRPPSRLEANDIAATRIVWRSESDELVRDPDGHLHLLRRT